jgi:integrase
MPRRSEGPVLNKQTSYYFLDQKIGFPPNRRRVRFSLRTKDKARALLLFEREYKRLWNEYYGLRSAGRAQGPITFESAAEDFIKYEREVRRVKCWGTIEQRLGVLAEILGAGRHLSSIEDDDSAAIDARLKEKGLSLGTVNHYFKLFKSFFAWAVDQKLHPGPNPVRAVRPYVIAQKRRAYSPDEVERILKATKEIELEARPQDEIMRHADRIVRVLLLTGLRAGELLNLKWSSVRGDRIVLERTETKQRQEKTIPITPILREFLAGLERQGEYVLPLRRRSGIMSPAYALGLIDRIRERTGIQDFVLHGLRHTAATIMVSEALGRGVGLADVMAILGHSRTETALRYQHADLARMKKAMDVLSKKTARRPIGSP